MSLPKVFIGDSILIWSYRKTLKSNQNGILRKHEAITQIDPLFYNNCNI